MGNTQFADAIADGFAIAEVSQPDAVDTYPNPGPRLTIPQSLQPGAKRISAVFSHILKNLNRLVDHHAIVA